MTRDVSLLAMIPVHNDAGRVARAVQSLLDQTVPPSRILVVDDGSTDDPASALQGFGDAVEIRHQENAGHIAARNSAIRDCREEFFASLDSDDVYEPRRFEMALDKMRHDETVAGTVCLAQNLRADGTKVGEPIQAFTFGALVARTSVFETVGLPQDTLLHGASLDWFIRAREAGVKIAVDEEPFLLRYLRHDSMSHSNRESSLKQHLDIVRASLKRRKSE